MVDNNAVMTSLVVVSTDRALIRLVALECREMAVSMHSMEQLPQRTENSALLLDLDGVGMSEALMTSEAVVAAGICRDASSLPAELRAKMSHVLPRPFRTHQLRALIGQLCGRMDVYTPDPVEYAPRPLINVSELAMRMENDTELLLGEQTIRLTPTEGAMMRLLIDRRGQTVSKEQLQVCLTSSDAESTNKLEVYVCFLRRKIERPTGLRLITTVRGKGYRLE